MGVSRNNFIVILILLLLFYYYYYYYSIIQLGCGHVHTMHLTLKIKELSFLPRAVFREPQKTFFNPFELSHNLSVIMSFIHILCKLTIKKKTRLKTTIAVFPHTPVCCVCFNYSIILNIFKLTHTFEIGIFTNECSPRGSHHLCKYLHATCTPHPQASTFYFFLNLLSSMITIPDSRLFQFPVLSIFPFSPHMEGKM